MKRMLLLLAFLTAMSCCKKEKEPEFDPSSLSGTYWVMELDGTYYLLSFLGSSALYESYDGYGASSSVKSIRFYEYAYQNMAGMLASSYGSGKKKYAKFKITGKKLELWWTGEEPEEWVGIFNWDPNKFGY